MNVVRWSRAGLVSSALLFGACQTPVALIQLDNEWATTYTAKQRAEQDANRDVLLATDFDVRLADLSRRAESQGDAVRSSDAAMAAAFYRIAASAAWQSGAHREADLLSIADKGVAACEALPNQDASQPRDCMFIRLMPHLALFDAKSRQIAALVSDGDEPRFPQEAFATVVRLARDVAGTATERGLLGELAAVLDGAAAAALDESFRAYIRENMNREHCAVLAWSGTLALSGAPQSDRDAVAASSRSAQTKLTDARVSTNCG
jgi:hypothetical protein